MDNQKRKGAVDEKNVNFLLQNELFRVRIVASAFISVAILTFCFNKLPHTLQMTNFETILQNLIKHAV